MWRPVLANAVVWRPDTARPLALAGAIHVAPPIKENIQSIDDARLHYRISCKGEPALTLPRRDAPEWIKEHIFLGYTTPREVIEV